MEVTEKEWREVRAALGGETLSVILPVYNLAVTVAANLAQVDSFLASGGLAYELVVVDDGSTDGTSARVRAFAAAHPAVVPVLLPQNAGKGHAIRAGFEASHGAFVLILDGDLDISPSTLPVFFRTLAQGRYDVVLGSKRHRDSLVQYPWYRRVASAFYFALVRIFIGLPVTDTQTGMKLFRRAVLGEALARMLVKTYAFDLELLAIAYGRGARLGEAPVEIRFGKKFGALRWRTVIDMVRDTLAVFYRLRLLNYYAHVEIPPPLAQPPHVTVIIACPGDSWMLRESLAALTRQTHPAFDVIVLPDDPIPALTPAQFPFPLAVIPTGKVRPAEKRNLGIARAQGEITAFLDDDAYPAEDWLAHAVIYFGEPSVGGVGGPGVTPPGDGFFAAAGGRVYANVLVSGQYRYRYLGGRVRRDVDDYPSCNLLVRTSLLREIGGYRTDFWPGEDTLLCEAIVHGRHKRIVYDPWALVYHHRRPLFLPHLRQLGRYGFHRGYFVKRFPATSCRLSYFIPSLFVLYLVALAVLWYIRAQIGGGRLGTWGMFAAWPFIVYLAATGLSSFSFNPLRWAVVWLGVFASHLVYGVRFLQGLFAGRAPCEFIGKDHAARG